MIISRVPALNKNAKSPKLNIKQKPVLTTMSHSTLSADKENSQNNVQ